MNQAVIIIDPRSDDHDNVVIGPFPSGEEASRWGFANISKDKLWYWLEITSPDSYLNR